MSRLKVYRFWWGIILLAILAPGATRAEDAPSPTGVMPTAVAPTAVAPRAEVTAPANNPFAQLRVVIPVDKLPPLRSVRLRGERDRVKGGTIVVSIQSMPKGAQVLYGGKLLGSTPLSITAPRHSTPYDVVLRRGGYMTLHARIKRQTNRSYTFKLTPAKFQ